MGTAGGKKKVDGFDARLLIWGWDYLEADFLRFYGYELYDLVWIDQISLRKFVILIAGLPTESSWVRFYSNKNEYSLPQLLC